jgi:hypothetical protein
MLMVRTISIAWPDLVGDYIDFICRAMVILLNDARQARILSMRAV